MIEYAETAPPPKSAALDAAWQVVAEGADQGAYGGAVALVAHGDAVVLHRAAGRAAAPPDAIPMRPDTIFDLASLTKVVATLPSVLLLIGAGELALETPIGAVLPEFGTSGWKADVTVRRLLSHTAGLPAWVPLYLDAVGPEEYLAAIAEVEPAAPPGERVIYSDLGIILLGEAVRRRGGLNVAAFARREIFAPLGMRDMMFTPPASLRPRIAATERGNGYEYGTCGERAASFDRWRTELVWGEVHDGNAYYGLDGIAGHAGLFATASDLLRYGRLWLHSGAWQGRQILPAALVREATRRQAPGRGLGWRVRPGDDEIEPDDPARELSARAYGHTGFTGTSLWLDPARDLTLVLLTNRVHPTPRDEISQIRPLFHERAAAAFPAEATA